MIGQLLALDSSATGALVAAYQRAAAGKDAPAPAPARGGTELRDGVAVVRIRGIMAKASSPLDRLILSILGGTDTAQARAAVLEAAAAPDVNAIVLYVDSPGGFVSGVGDLADAVQEARGRKPVVAYIEDLGASAAYYVAAQADSVTVNPSGLVGSIGVYSVLYDLSGAAAAAGVRVVVVASSELKGTSVDGAPVSDAAIAETRRLVDGRNAQFVEAVARGRGVSLAQARAWATGQVHFAADALRLGLVDGVGSLEGALAAARSTTARPAMRSSAAPARPRNEVKTMKTSSDIYAEMRRRAVALVAQGKAPTVEQGMAADLRTPEGGRLYQQYAERQAAESDMPREGAVS